MAFRTKVSACEFLTPARRAEIARLRARDLTVGENAEAVRWPDCLSLKNLERVVEALPRPAVGDLVPRAPVKARGFAA